MSATPLVPQLDEALPRLSARHEPHLERFSVQSGDLGP